MAVCCSLPVLAVHNKLEVHTDSGRVEHEGGRKGVIDYYQKILVPKTAFQALGGGEPRFLNPDDAIQTLCIFQTVSETTFFSRLRMDERITGLGKGHRVSGRSANHMDGLKVGCGMTPRKT